MIEKDHKPIVAGFLYTTNSNICWMEWIISNPEYRNTDRQEAIELLINMAEEICKKQGQVHMFSIGRNKHLIETHKKLGWHIDSKPSHEIIKNI